MQTLGTEALVNAGFVLFAITILGTLIFGRFFCGWGCHLIAYQDLCTWLLKKAGIKLRPFRSRLLVFVPLGAAVFMFILPTVVRVLMGSPRASFTPHFETYDFWDRFPGWFVGSLTIFVCGFVVVYFLGNKGFCTYACPYGGFFGVADKVAPGRIRVTDACEQCGHCTAACSSNVRVHEEVNSYGMVVNPGCMKCMDCISVCPKDALFFGFKKRSSIKTKPQPTKSPRYDFSWPEELAMVAIFLVSLVILRKLYDGVPFLLALTLASISSYMGISAVRFLHAPQPRFARFQLRSNGKTTRAGYVFLAATALWSLFLGHSAVVQILTVSGRRALNTARTMSNSSGGRAQHVAREQLNRGIAYLEKADSLGLVPVVNLLFDLSIAYAGRGEQEKAKLCLQRAIDFSPNFAAGYYELAGLLTSQDDYEAAISKLCEVVRIAPEFPKAHSDLANLLIQLGRGGEAVKMLGELAEQRPDVVEFQLARGLALAHSGAYDLAIEVMRETVDQWPAHADGHFNLGSTLASRGDLTQALEALQEAARLNPESGLIYFGIATVAGRTGDLALAERNLSQACGLEPFNADYVRAWVSAVHLRGALSHEIETAEKIAPNSRAARYRLIYLYAAAGREDDARRVAEEFSSPEVTR